MADEEGELQPIIVKKIKKGGGHHGGAWKVAYADFVTAMMAFFLLLWLLNVSTDEQREAISNYFDPSHTQVSQNQSGAGGVLGGLSVAPEGAMVTNVQPISAPKQPSGTAAVNKSAQKETSKEKIKTKEMKVKSAIEKAKETIRKAEEARLNKAKNALEEAINKNPELADLKENILIDMTPEGLRIQVIDKDGKPMFASGSARMFEKTQKLLQQVGNIIKEEPNQLSIRGHTDSVPYGSGAKYTNWELSSDRANSSRRVLLESGLTPERIENVVGKADTEHLLPDDPTNASNRRISIILLKEELTNPEYFEKKAKEAAGDDIQAINEEVDAEEDAKAPPPPTMPKIGTFKKSSGAVEFP